jgi:hypothetical protein
MNFIYHFGGRVRYQHSTYWYDPKVFTTHEVETAPLEFKRSVYPLRFARALYWDGPLTSRPDRRGGFDLSLPHWVLALLTAVMPAAFIGSRVKRRRGVARLARGLCPSCGYDLRATPDRCPECGRSTKPPTTAIAE